MSLDGQVLWNRMLTGPCAWATAGAATVAAAATAPPFRNLRLEPLPAALSEAFITSSHRAQPWRLPRTHLTVAPGRSEGPYAFGRVSNSTRIRAGLLTVF